MQRNQKIYCDVSTCKHNENASYCSLQQIMVSPASMSTTGTDDHDSICASYESA